MENKQAGAAFGALVVDDDPDVRAYVTRVLAEFGFVVGEAEDLRGAREMLGRADYQLIFLDKRLPDGDGVEFSRTLVGRDQELHVIVITGEGSGEEAISARECGVYDYLAKPVRTSEVRDLVRRIISLYAADKAEAALPAADPTVSGPVLIARSKRMIDVAREAYKIARTNLPVLISGETGTGKEVLARKIHALSDRAKEEFVPVNCGAIPQELIESELFGHLRGSFTSADRDRPGLFEAAHQGTIFLDEITETTAAFQVKLLRVIQEGKIRRVGSNREISLDVRVIAASNRRIEEEVSQGKFRQDLYYRLKVCPLNLPPLRDRVEDIIPLAEHFARGRRPDAVFSDAVRQALKRYAWPGNVRELENVVDYAVQNCSGKVLTGDLPKDLRAAVGELKDEENDIEIGRSEGLLPLREVERLHIERALRMYGGNKSQAAKALGIDRHTINCKLSPTGEAESGDAEDRD